MKTIFLKISLIVLLLLLMGAGCKKDDRYSLYYEGEVVILENKNGCFDILKITSTPEKASLLSGSSVSFDSKLYTKKKLEIGDKVYFKIIQYSEPIDPSTPCAVPQYIAQIEF